MTPDEIRPYLLDFERKGHTNPTLMTEILRGHSIVYRQVYRGDDPTAQMPRLAHGLVRVQWGGPWTKPGVPMRVRYRHTHWVAVEGGHVFDINAICVGGWIPYAEWATQLVPWLIRECCPKGDGTWWPTHAIEIPVVADDGERAWLSEPCLSQG